MDFIISLPSCAAGCYGQQNFRTILRYYIIYGVVSFLIFLGSCSDFCDLCFFVVLWVLLNFFFFRGFFFLNIGDFLFLEHCGILGSDSSSGAGMGIAMCRGLLPLIPGCLGF